VVIYGTPKRIADTERSGLGERADDSWSCPAYFPGVVRRFRHTTSGPEVSAAAFTGASTQDRNLARSFRTGAAVARAQSLKAVEGGGRMQTDIHVVDLAAARTGDFERGKRSPRSIDEHSAREIGSSPSPGRRAVEVME